MNIWEQAAVRLVPSAAPFSPPLHFRGAVAADAGRLHVVLVRVLAAGALMDTAGDALSRQSQPDIALGGARASVPHDPDRGQGREQNHLLRLLARSPDEPLLQQMETVMLEAKHVVYGPDECIPYVYFPETAVCSVVKVMSDGRRVEVCTIGNEGTTGVPVFLGASSTRTQCFIQIAGTAKRLSAAAFRDAARDRGALHDILQPYAQYLFDQVAQAVACNRLHALEQRCARWLLMTHDRVGADQFALTQEFLSFMLGVHRPAVTIAEGALRHAGLIRYSRGKVRVLDRAGLEAAACECYASDRANFDRLLGPSSSPGVTSSRTEEGEH